MARAVSNEINLRRPGHRQWHHPPREILTRHCGGGASDDTALLALRVPPARHRIEMVTRPVT